VLSVRLQFVPATVGYRDGRQMLQFWHMSVALTETLKEKCLRKMRLEIGWMDLFWEWMFDVYARDTARLNSTLWLRTVCLGIAIVVAPDGRLLYSQIYI
jgi:hypothetical protein